MRIKYFDILESAQNCTSSFNTWVLYLKKYSLTNSTVKLLEGIPQGLKYHPEFCTLKHTYLVVQAVWRLKEPRLLEAAFLHDVGKKTRTTVGNKRIYSYGHAEHSAKFVEEKKEHIKEFDFTYNIVKKHMDFKDISSSKLKNDTDLRTFIIADKILSKTLYQEFFPFYDSYLNKIKAWYTYFRQRNSCKKIYITIGPSGSGKSTYLRRKFPENIVVCPDLIRKEMTGDISNQSKNSQVWEETLLKLRGLLDTKKKAVLDATNVNTFYRITFMSNFNDCQKHAIVSLSNEDKCKERVIDDIESGLDRPNVPAKVIEKQFRNHKKSLRSIKKEFNKITYIDVENM